MKPHVHPPLNGISLAKVMRALSDPCRLSIVRTLLSTRKKEMACHEIPLKVVKATRSHHFSVLREAGLAFTRIEGTKCMTTIREKEVNQRFPGLLKLVAQEKSKAAGRKKPRPTKIRKL